MRFDDLFDDLESQLEAELGAEERDTLAEEERFRVGRLELRDRLVRAPGVLDLTLSAGARLRIERQQVGRDWVSGTVLDGGPVGADCIVPVHAVVGLRLEQAAVQASLEEPRQQGLTSRLSLGFALRDLARRRVAVELRCPDPVHGTLDRVGRDHCDLAMHEAGTPRRQAAVTGVQVVPFSAIQWVRVVD